MATFKSINEPKEEPTKDDLSELSLEEDDDVQMESKDDNADEPEFRGFTPLEVEANRAKKRPLLTDDDLQFESDFDLLSSIIATPSAKPKIKLKRTSSSSPATSPKPHIPVALSPMATHQPTKKPLPAPMARESRGWKPSAQFFKPLTAGWKREVIYGRENGQWTSKPTSIVYHAPIQHGCKPRKFQTLAELGPFCKYYQHVGSWKPIRRVRLFSSVIVVSVHLDVTQLFIS